MNGRGIALVSVLFCLLVSLVLAATLFFTWFVDAEATANASAGDDALAVAEAGIHHLWSMLEPAPGFDRELGWPAGEPPFGAIVGFPRAPRTYRVLVSAAPGGALAVVSRGTSHRGTRRAVEATFSRAAFRPQATLVLPPGTTLSVGAGTLDASAAGTDPEVPALAGEEATEAAALGRGAVVVGPSGYADALSPLRAAADATYDTPQTAGAWGTAATPAITRLSGTVEVLGDVTATGIVIADAPLRISGRLEVDGLLLAPAGVDVAGELVVRGASWVATELRLTAPGAFSLVDSVPALAAADAAGRGLLPRPAVLTAWREVW